MLPRVAGGGNLSLDAPLAEAAGDDQAVEGAQAVALQQVRHGGRLDPLDLDLGAVVEAGVAQRLDHRQVGVGKVHVLADDADPHRADGGGHLLDEVLPAGQVDRVVGHGDLEDLEQVAVESLLVEHEGDLVDVVGVDAGHDRLDGHVAQQRDLPLQVLGDHPVGPADDDVWLDALAAQVGHGVLGRLGLLLPRRPQVRHQGQVHVGHVGPAHVAAELPDRLDERQDLDVADRAADLHDDDVHPGLAQLVDVVLDLVGDVGDHLDGLAQVVAPPLLGDDRGVDAAGGGVRALVEVLVDEPLVVAEVEVGLPTVLGHEHLAVLEGVHGARVHVDVRVELAHRHLQPPALEEPSEGGGGEPLAERRGHPAGEEDVLGLSSAHVASITIGHPPRLPERAATGCGPPTTTGGALTGRPSPGRPGPRGARARDAGPPRSRGCPTACG